MIEFTSFFDYEFKDGVHKPVTLAITFDEEDKERIYQALFRGTNTLSPPDMELIKLLEDLRK